MKKLLLLAFSLFSFLPVSGQATYRGTVGTLPIELVAQVYPSGDTKAFYAYTKFNTPIPINGRIDAGTLTLFEEDTHGNITAEFTFKNFNAETVVVNGTWKNLRTKKTLPVSIKKSSDLKAGEKETTGLLQEISLTDYYFRLVLSNTTGDFAVTGIKVLKKGTDVLHQQFDVDCMWQGLNGIQVSDYNFDGHPDFSIFESSYAGPNTSRLYFLYEPSVGKFIESGFQGTSLSFDPVSQTVSEHNQCCAGASHTTAIYKIVDNKMVLLEEHCFKWDEDKQELTERPVEECR